MSTTTPLVIAATATDVPPTPKRARDKANSDEDMPAKKKMRAMPIAPEADDVVVDSDRESEEECDDVDTNLCKECGEELDHDKGDYDNLSTIYPMCAKCEGR